MRFTNVLGLAVMAAVVAMAFVGASSASAQHKIVLCKELVALCPKDKLWQSGTKLLALAEKPTLTSSFGTVECEDSTVTGETLEEIGNPLKVSIGKPEFGKLGTVNLGNGCTGACASEVENGVHTLPFENAQIEVEAVDKYFLKATGLAVLLDCLFSFFNVTCSYRRENVKVPINHSGKHPLHPGENLPQIVANITLNRVTAAPHSGSGFCPATSEWVANYVIHLVDPPTGDPGLGWPSLDL